MRPKRYSLHLYLGPTIPLGLALPCDDDDDDDDAKGISFEDDDLRQVCGEAVQTDQRDVTGLLGPRQSCQDPHHKDDHIHL